MKPYQLYISILLVAFSLHSCKKLFHEPEVDQPKFTWKGTVYKALGDEVWPNATMTLIAEQQGLSGMNYTTVASGVSDENGKFELTYERFTTAIGRYNTDGSLNQNQQLGQLTLNGNGEVLMIGPWNVDVQQDFCQRGNVNLTLKINDFRTTDTSLIDTLYMYSDYFAFNTFIKGGVEPFKFMANNGAESYGYRVLNPKTGVFNIVNEFAANCFNVPVTLNLYYSLKPPSQKSGSDLSKVTMGWHGFPYRDSVTINLKDDD